MASIQELREETYKVIHETEQGGNSASRIGNLYNGIIDFLGILDDRTVNPYYYDDTALKEAIRRVDAAIVELDRTLDAALVLVNQERQRLDDLVNSIDGEIQENVENMLNDAQWLQEHAQGIQQMVNEGEIEWKSEWDQNVEAYLQEVGVWAREGDVIKTQWTEIVQSVDEISSTVAEVQTDLAGRPTATQWTQITQKVNGIEQSVNALLYEGETTEALQSSINQSIDGKVASLNLETTYAKIDTEDSKEIIEWMYSALRNETTSEKTFNDIVSAGKSGLLNGVSNIHTYVEVVRNGEVLDYVAGSSIEAKVNDAVTGLYNKASAGDVQTTIFSQVKKDTSDIATIVTHATGDYTSASIATKFDRWKTGLALKTDIDSASASLIATMDEKDNASALILEQSMEQSLASMTTQFDNKLAGCIAYSDFEEAFVTMIAEDPDNGAVAQIFARANEEGSEIQLSADKVVMTNAFAESITTNSAFIGFLEGDTATFRGTVYATNGEFSGKVTSKEGSIGGFTIGEHLLKSSNENIILKDDGSAILNNATISGGYIGGFRISDGSLGSWTFPSTGTTYLNSKGYLYLINEDNPNGAIMASGGVTLEGDASHNITITNNASGGKVNIYGSKLNLNTINSGATYIGNSNAFTSITGTSFSVHSDDIRLNDSSNGSVKVVGVASLGGNVMISSFQLPSSPNIGQFYFCKGISSDLTISIPSGYKLYKPGDSDYYTGSFNCGRYSMIVVYIDSNNWVIYDCG